MLIQDDFPKGIRFRSKIIANNPPQPLTKSNIVRYKFRESVKSDTEPTIPLKSDTKMYFNLSLFTFIRGHVFIIIIFFLGKFDIYIFRIDSYCDF